MAKRQCSNCLGRGWNCEPVPEPPIPKVPCAVCQRKNLELRKHLKNLKATLDMFTATEKALQAHLPEMQKTGHALRNYLSLYCEAAETHQTTRDMRAEIARLHKEGVWGCRE